MASAEQELLRQILEAVKGSSTGKAATDSTKTDSAYEGKSEDQLKADQVRLDLKQKDLELSKQVAKSRKRQLELEEDLFKLEEERLDVEIAYLNQTIKGSDTEKARALERALERKQELKDRRELKQERENELRNIRAATASFLGLAEAQRSVDPSSLINKMKDLNKISTQIAQTGISMNDVYGDSTNLFDVFTDSTERSTKSLGVFVGQAVNAKGEMEALTQYGVGFEELNESMMSLRMSMAGFSDEALENQSYLMGNASKMKALGVSVEEQGKNWNYLTKSLGLSAKQAADTTDKLARVAITAGIPVKNLLREFGQIGPQLAAQGPKAIEIFSNLAKQAKSLGVEVSTLMTTFGSAMDTFEGAANAAGKFNAVMGGDYLNAMELLNATEDQRVDIVKRQMDATGKNFATMSKYEKIAVANALGIKDVNEAQMILSGSTEEMRKKKEQEAATQEKLNKLQADAVEIGTKLGSVFQVAYGAILPFLEIIEKVANVITWINDKTKGLLGIAVTGLLMAKGLSLVTANLRTMEFSMIRAGLASFRASGGFMAATKSLFSLSNIKANAGSFLSLIIQFLPLVIMLFEAFHDTLLKPHSPILMDTLSTTLPAAFEAIGKSLEPLIKPMLAFGAAMLMVGGAVLMTAYGMAQLVKSFASLNGPQLIAAVVALGLLAVTVVGMSFALSALVASGVGPAAAGLLLAFGASFLMIGAGVYLAAAGMSQFVDKVASLATVGADGALAILSISMALLALSSSIGILVVSLAGLMIMGATGPLGFLALSAGIMMATVAIKELSSAFDEFPAEKSINFSASSDSLIKTLAAVKDIKSDDIKPTIEVMRAAQEYMITAASVKASPNDDPAVKLLSKILEVVNAAATTRTAGTDTGQQKVQLTIDEKVFGELVLKTNPGLSRKTATTLAT